VRSTTSQKSWSSRLCKNVASARLSNGAPQANKLYFRYVGGSSRRGSDATVAYRWWHIAASQQTTDTRKYCRLRPSEMHNSESCKANGDSLRSVTAELSLFLFLGSRNGNRSSANEVSSEVSSEEGKKRQLVKTKEGIIRAQMRRYRETDLSPTNRRVADNNRGLCHIQENCFACTIRYDRKYTIYIRASVNLEYKNTLRRSENSESLRRRTSERTRFSFDL